MPSEYDTLLEEAPVALAQASPYDALLDAASSEYDSLLDDLPEKANAATGGVIAPLQDIGRSFVRGTGSAISSVGGAVSALPNAMFPGAPMPEAVTGLYRKVGDTITGLGESLEGTVKPTTTGTFEPENPQWWVEKLPAVFPQLAAQLGIAAATKGAGNAPRIAAFAGGGGAQMAGNAYNEALRDRKARGEAEEVARQGAAAEATIVGVIGSALEAIPGAEYLTKGPVGAVVSKFLRSPNVANLVARGGTEALVERFQQYSEIKAAEKLRGKVLTPEEVDDQLNAATFLGLGAGSAASIAIDSASTPLTAEAVRETTTETGGGDNLNERSTTRIDNQSPLQGVNANRDEPTGPDEGQYGGSQGQQAPGDYAPGNLQAGGQGTPGPAGDREGGDVTSTPEPSPLASATEPMGAAGEVPDIEQPEAEAVQPEVSKVPSFAARFDKETLLQRPAWVQPGSALDKVLGDLRERNDPFYAVDVRGVWKSLTPAQRQDLAARGWTTTNMRDPNAVALHVANDAVAARRFYGMQNRRAARELTSPSAPSTGTSPTTEGTAATPTGEVEAGAGVVPSQPEPTAFPGKRKEQYSVPYEQLDTNEKLARDLFDGVGKVEPLSPELEAKVDKAEEIAGEKIRLRPKEGGGFGTGGGLIPTLGSTPSGSVPIRIPSAIKRIGRGLFTEGSADVLARQENPVAQELSDAIREHVDQEQVLFAEAAIPMERAMQGMTDRQRDAAFKEVEKYYREKENGRPVPKLTPNAQKIVTAWEDIAELTGKNVAAAGTLLYDSKLGGYRAPKLIGRDYLPRRFSKEVEAVFRDRKTDSVLWNNLVRALATHKGISEDVAAAELQATAGRFRKNDHFANIEMARGEQLPEIFYDYDLRNIMATYIPRYAERLAQIKAYGQRLLGPGGMPIQENLFDKARKETQDQYSEQYINEIEQQATNFRVVNSASSFAQRAQTVANTVLLSSPTTTVLRNMISGTGATAEMFGVDRAARGLIDAAKPQSFADAREIGAIRSNMAELLNADQLGDSPIDDALRNWQNIALKWSGYNGSELFVRTHAAMTASQYAQDAALAIAGDPMSAPAQEAKALFKRMGVDETAILSEAGDWKNGPETRKFIRAIIRDSQGGYRFDQVPLWANSAAGRFFYQYGRYGVQRSRNLFKNGVRPLLDAVKTGSLKEVSRNYQPLMRMLIAAGLMGEIFALLAKGLFDRDRRDASLKEIGTAWSEDKKKSVAMAFERLLNDVITGGTLGIVSQPLDWARSLKDQTRFKDPFQPPGTAPLKAATTLVQNLLDQGTVSQRDLESFASSLVPGVEQVGDVVKNLTGNERYKAQQDLSTLRNAAIRWGKQKGLDVAPRVRDRSAMRKSPKAPIFEPIKDALMVGDAAEAQRLAREYVQAQPPDKQLDAARSVIASVDNSQPFRAGPYRGNDRLAQFDVWAKKNLPKAMYDRSARVQNTYVTAAIAAGLMEQ